MLQLGHRCLALRFAIDWRMLGRAQSAGNVGLMEALSYRIIGIRCVSAIGRIVLPVNVVSRQVFSCYVIEIIYINIDVIAIMRVIAVVVVVIVMVMVIIIPVDTAEQRPGGGHAEAVPEAFDEAIGKLLPGRGRQIDRRIGAVRPGTIDGGGVIAGNIDHLWIGRLYFNDLRGRRRRCVGGCGCCRAAAG